MQHPLTIVYTPLPQGSVDELHMWRCAFGAALEPWLDTRQQEHVSRFGRSAAQTQTAAAPLQTDADRIKILGAKGNGPKFLGQEGIGLKVVGLKVLEAALSRLMARAQLITTAAVHHKDEKAGALPPINMDSHGRPQLEGWRAAFSHSGRAAFCALAPAGQNSPALGLDAEALTSPPPHASAFAAHELAVPPALPQEYADREALRRWTIKEAMLKAAGLGLGMQPAQIPTGRFGQRAGLWQGPLGPMGWRAVACPGHWLSVAQAGHIPPVHIKVLRQNPHSLLRCLADVQQP